MKIIEPSFTLSTPFGALTRDNGNKMLRFIEKQARISHRSEERQTPDSWKRFIEAVVMQHGDWSVTEHATVTATIRTDRGVTHELVRHRLFTYTQESTRFVRYKDELEFVAPLGVDPYAFDDVVAMHFKNTYHEAERRYHEMLERRVSPQVARGILPTTLAATIAVTGNLRSWRQFFLMRTTRETHPDFRRITVPMLVEFQDMIPLLYDDISPDASQRHNLEKAR